MKHFSVKRWLGNLSLQKKLFLIIAVFLAAVAVIVFIAEFGLENLSTVRAYVAAEGMYEKTEKDAVYCLHRYTETHSKDDYQRFQDLIKQVSGYKEARLELEKPKPDLEIAYRGFMQGGSHPDDVKEMARMFRLFHRFEFMDKGIKLWTEADLLVSELEKLGKEINECVLSCKDRFAEEHLKMEEEYLQKVDAINEKITDLGDRFSFIFGEISRQAARVLVWLMTAGAIVIGGIGVFLVFIIGRNITKRAVKLSQAVEKIGKGDFTVKTETGVKDEIGVLSVSINNMAEELQQSYKDIQKKQEELGVMNEELISTNEELTSTNEELTQANEELESTTEELRLANSEAQKARETAEKKTEEMERFHKVAVGRELKMRELKERIRELEGKSEDQGASSKGNG